MEEDGRLNYRAIRGGVYSGLKAALMALRAAIYLAKPSAKRAKSINTVEYVAQLWQSNEESDEEWRKKREEWNMASKENDSEECLVNEICHCVSWPCLTCRKLSMWEKSRRACYATWLFERRSGYQLKRTAKWNSERIMACRRRNNNTECMYQYHIIARKCQPAGCLRKPQRRNGIANEEKRNGAS